MAHVRPSIIDVNMEIAHILARRGECIRRQVGAVITDANNRILSTGYNGVAPGEPSCFDCPCEGASKPSGTGLELCRASHAEISALITCPDISRAANIYCTTEPCISCTKALLLTNITQVYYREPYLNSGVKLWQLGWRRV